MRVVITGGGTGGHIYPAISVGQTLKDLASDTELLFIGSSHGPEGELFKQVGFNFMSVPSAPLTKSISLKNVSAFIKLVSSVFKAKRLLDDFKPDVVIGTGGYTSAAVLIAQHMRKGKLIIHEQNIVPGRTNCWLARFADKICITYEKSASAFPDEKVIITGMPVRKEFFCLPQKDEARKKLGLKEQLFTIFVVGGSQGAKKLNDIVVSAWPLIDDGNTQVYHQTGTRNLADVKKQAPDTDKYIIDDYVDMPQALASADLVICRTGASTIFEVCAAGLPSIHVPYPYAYADHQRLNGRFVESAGASIMLEEAGITKNIMAEEIIGLRSSKEHLDSMSHAAKWLVDKESAKKIAQTAINIAMHCRN